MSSCSSSSSSSGSVCCSSPPVSSLSQLFSRLDSAAEFMMVHRDFHAAFDTCSRGLESLASTDSEDNSRRGELKAAFCIIGVQALAELNQWGDVFSWVLQQYEHLENIPAKIMQMCILLHSKVGEPAVVQEAARVWLHSSSCKAPGFRTVAELYLLHVLVPLEHLEEARELVSGELGLAVFTEDQRQTALDVVEEKARQKEESSLNPDSESAGHASPQGTIIQKLQAMLRFLYRRCLMAGCGSFPLQRVFLAAVLLYMLLLKMDPGMRGLTNYYLSCCVNSLLQSLAATWELAGILEKWATAGLRADSRNVPLQLKKVLAAMRRDPPQPYPHRDFLTCLDRNSIHLNIQHDADEVFLSILNLIQQQMEDMDLALEIQNLYKISLETQLQCLECNSVQSRRTYLLSLPLHIKEDHNSLEGCMASFFEHQELRGANSCFCSQCGTRKPSRQGVKLNSLPRILCIQLKRFRNMRGSTRKLDCKVTFPETFDFSESLREVFASNFSQDGCRYSLYAVVVHCGCAVSGHYTAFLRHKDNERWYYADDSHVQQISWEDVQTSYGGHYRGTAYMLMYRRDWKKNQHQPELSG